MENANGTVTMPPQEENKPESLVASPNWLKITEERNRNRRLLGKPTPSLRAQLRACNIPQLKTVKKLCDQYIRDHKSAPDEILCGKPFTEAVLFSIPLKNKRFQFEIRNRPAKKSGFIYLNGPYLYAYHRDGKYIHETYFKKKEWNKLPRKIRIAMKPFLTQSAIAPYIEKIKTKHAEARNLEGQNFGPESEEIPF